MSDSGSFFRNRPRGPPRSARPPACLFHDPIGKQLRTHLSRRARALRGPRVRPHDVANPCRGPCRAAPARTVRRATFRGRAPQSGRLHGRDGAGGAPSDLSWCGFRTSHDIRARAHVPDGARDGAFVEHARRAVDAPCTSPRRSRPLRIPLRLVRALPRGRTLRLHAARARTMACAHRARNARGLARVPTSRRAPHGASGGDGRILVGGGLGALGPLPRVALGLFDGQGPFLGSTCETRRRPGARRARTGLPRGARHRNDGPLYHDASPLLGPFAPRARGVRTSSTRRTLRARGRAPDARRTARAPRARRRPHPPRARAFTRRPFFARRSASFLGSGTARRLARILCGLRFGGRAARSSGNARRFHDRLRDRGVSRTLLSPPTDRQCSTMPIDSPHASPAPTTS